MAAAGNVPGCGLKLGFFGVVLPAGQLAAAGNVPGCGLKLVTRSLERHRPHSAAAGNVPGCGLKHLICLLPVLPLDAAAGNVPGCGLKPTLGIDFCYGESTIEAILERLRSSEEADARAAAAVVEAKSPTALKVTLRALREATAIPSLAACLARDYRLVCALLGSHDLAEGIRAVVVDKRHRPRWKPAHLEDVFEDAVDVYFRERDDTSGRALAVK